MIIYPDNTMPPPPPAPPPPPPPAPGPGAGAGAAPAAALKTVPLLGDALHEMKKKLTGFEETPAAAEGISITSISSLDCIALHMIDMFSSDSCPCCCSF